MHQFKHSVLVLVVCAMFTAASVANSHGQEERIDLTKQKIIKGKFKEARSIIRQADLEIEEHRRAFFLGLADQYEAARAVGQRKSQLLSSAAKHYERALTINPNWSPALNNLARIRLDEGRVDEAKSKYSQAIENSADQKSMYSQKAVDAFQGKLPADQNLEILRRNVELGSPDSTETAQAHRQVMELVQRRPNDCLDYLWETAESGKPRLAGLAAFDVLSRWNQEDQVNELFSLIAFSMSKMGFSRERFAEDEFKRRLTESAQVPGALAPASQLLDLFATQRIPSRIKYDWWSRHYDPYRDPKRGYWCKDSFEKLIVSIGDEYRSKTNLALAEKYYRLGFDLSGVNPRALFRLADLYVSTGRQEELNSILQAYDGQIYKAKGDTYKYKFRVSQLKEMFEFHRALGYAYAKLGQFASDDSRVRNAVFQISRAYDVAERLSAVDSKKNYIVDSGLTLMLANWYQETGQDAKSTALLVSQSKLYAKNKNLQVSRDLVAAVDAVKLTPEQLTWTNQLASLTEEQEKRSVKQAKQQAIVRTKEMFISHFEHVELELNRTQKDLASFVIDTYVDELIDARNAQSKLLSDSQMNQLAGRVSTVSYVPMEIGEDWACSPGTSDLERIGLSRDKIEKYEKASMRTSDVMKRFEIELKGLLTDEQKASLPNRQRNNKNKRK